MIIDYRGEIKVALHNDSEDVKGISNGDRIAQLIISPFCEIEFEEADSLDQTESEESGFGSTGR